MRLIVGVLACVAASAVTVAMADPPASPAAAPSATASTTATPAADSAKASISNDDGALLAAGYKPQMRGGQKVWCRREAQTTGTRLSRDKETCNTADTVKEQLKNGREMTERSQKNQLNKGGN